MRIEKRTDLYLSTLRGYVEALGGRLSLVVEFPDRAPVVLAGLGDEHPSKPSRQKAQRKPATVSQTMIRRRSAA